ncbi:unnamed protein product [Camellia sinensis]
MNLHTRRGQQSHGNSENCAKIVGKDPALEGSIALSQGYCYSQRAQSSQLKMHAEEGARILGEGKFLESDSFLGNERTKYCLTSKIPLGVILAIPPFNYPVNLAVSKIGPALIAGNYLVLKPPTQKVLWLPSYGALLPLGWISQGPHQLYNRERL